MATNKKQLYRLTDVRKSWQIGEVTVEALRGLSIDLAEGEFVALQGPSGSGKSTLLNVLGLLEIPTSGGIEFHGRRLDGCSESELTNVRQEYIGFIFQNFNLIPVLSAQENVEYALYLEQKFSKREVVDRARAALAGVGLEKFATHKPRELSGGQRQRVAIARALVKRPKLILADEPTANLDSKTAEQILELVGELKTKAGTTVLVATHDKATADRAERIIRIRDGQLDS